MKRFTTKLTGLSAASSLLPAGVFAQTPNDITTPQATGLLAGIGIMILVFLLVALLSFVFWLIMLIHAIQNDIPDKSLWLVILLVSLVTGFGLIGALVYYFVVKKKFDPSQKKPAEPQPKP